MNPSELPARASLRNTSSAYRNVLHRQSRQLMDSGEWREALALWKHLHSLELVSAELYLDAAICFAKLGQNEDALRLLDQSLNTFAETASSEYFENAATLAASLKSAEADDVAARAYELALQRFSIQALPADAIRNESPLPQ